MLEKEFLKFHISRISLKNILKIPGEYSQKCHVWRISLKNALKISHWEIILDFFAKYS